jgi:hypothetical protein
VWGTSGPTATNPTLCCPFRFDSLPHSGRNGRKGGGGGEKKKKQQHQEEEEEEEDEEEVVERECVCVRVCACVRVGGGGGGKQASRLALAFVVSSLPHTTQRKCSAPSAHTFRARQMCGGVRVVYTHLRTPFSPTTVAVGIAPPPPPPPPPPLADKPRGRRTSLQTQKTSLALHRVHLQIRTNHNNGQQRKAIRFARYLKRTIPPFSFSLSLSLSLLFNGERPVRGRCYAPFHDTDLMDHTKL